jgi:hypothetical protein
MGTDTGTSHASSDCSGRGSVIPGSTECICIDNWSNIGDFALDGSDCDIFVPAVLALWSLALLCATRIAFAIISYFINYYTIQVRRKQAGTLTTSVHNGLSIKDPRVLFPLWFLLFAVSSILLSCFKLYSPVGYLIGYTPSVTFLTASISLTSAYGLATYQILAVNFFSAGYIKMLPSVSQSFLASRVQIVRTFIACIYVLVPIVQTAPLLTGLLFPTYYDIFAIEYFCITFCIVGSLTHTRRMATATLILAIEKYVEFENNNRAMNEIFENLKKLQRHYIPRLTIIVATLIFGIVPYLRRKSSYILPLMVVGFLLATMSLMNTMAVLKKVGKNRSTHRAMSVPVRTRASVGNIRDLLPASPMIQSNSAIAVLPASPVRQSSTGKLTAPVRASVGTFNIVSPFPLMRQPSQVAPAVSDVDSINP